MGGSGANGLIKDTMQCANMKFYNPSCSFYFYCCRILSPINLNKDSDKISIEVGKLKNNLRVLDGG